MRRKMSVPAMLILVTAASVPCSLLAAPVTAGGYAFTNFDAPGVGANAGSGTNANGISNAGAAVGFAINDNQQFTNFVRNPDGTITVLNINGSTNANAFGINSAGAVVGNDGTGNAFYRSPGGNIQTFIPSGVSATALGVNDKGNIVGQFTTASGTMPGFYESSVGGSPLRIDSPVAADVVNAQGINNLGAIVGFYTGADGQFHGFSANVSNATNGSIPMTLIADPTIPNVAGEPGATFVFSQILGVNDQGLAVGYYGDSTTSQHGFIYNLSTGSYSFLDDPSEAFDNGVEVTQITGINNLDEITGFYSDSAGLFHGFVACPEGVSCTAATATPEPESFLLAGLGIGALLLGGIRRRRV